MATKKKEAVEVVKITPIRKRVVSARIIGDTPLITSAWGPEGKWALLRPQLEEGITEEGKKKRKNRDPRNKVKEFISNINWISGKPEEYTEEAFNQAVKNGAKFGFPASGIKKASLDAAMRMGWTQHTTEMRGMFHIQPLELSIDREFDIMLEIKGDSPVMREDTVRLGGQTRPADLRFRPMFTNWYIDFLIEYVENGPYKLEDILACISAGGAICGIGEWRPQKSGSFGMYHLDTVKDE